MSELLEAAERVLAGLNARIEAAPSEAKPVFDGIAALHDAINRAKVLQRPVSEEGRKLAVFNEDDFRALGRLIDAIPHGIVMGGTTSREIKAACKKVNDGLSALRSPSPGGRSNAGGAAPACGVEQVPGASILRLHRGSRSLRRQDGWVDHRG